MNNILNHKEIEQKITRLGHQVLENCFEEPVIYIGGICGNGLKLAKQLKAIMASNSDQEIHVFEITVNKSN